MRHSLDSMERNIPEAPRRDLVFFINPTRLRRRRALRILPGAACYRILILGATLAFLDAYLRMKPDAKLWLATNQLSRSSNRLAQMSSK